MLNDLDPGPAAELVHAACPLVFDRLDADTQVRGDFGIRMSEGDEPEDLLLTRREWPPAACTFVRSRGHHTAHHPAGESGVDVGLATGYPPDGRQQLLGRCLLDHITTGAGAHRVMQVALIAMPGQDDHRDLRCDLPQPFGGTCTIHAGHGQIHDNDVGPEFEREPYALTALFGLAHHRNVFLAAEHHAHAFTHQGVVVDQKDIDGRFHAPSSAASDRGIRANTENPWPAELS